MGLTPKKLTITENADFKYATNRLCQPADTTKHKTACSDAGLSKSNREYSTRPMTIVVHERLTGAET